MNEMLKLSTPEAERLRFAPWQGVVYNRFGETEGGYLCQKPLKLLTQSRSSHEAEEPETALASVRKII